MSFAINPTTDISSLRGVEFGEFVGFTPELRRAGCAYVLHLGGFEAASGYEDPPPRCPVWPVVKNILRDPVFK